jgi:hypothetical protein
MPLEGFGIVTWQFGVALDAGVKRGAARSVTRSLAHAGRARDQGSAPAGGACGLALSIPGGKRQVSWWEAEAFRAWRLRLGSQTQGEENLTAFR